MTIAQRILLPVLLLAAGSVQAQDDPKAVLDQIAGKVALTWQSDASYGLFLHYDKPWYQAGSTIWFRAYLYNRTSRQPAPVKDHLYVELVSGDSLVRQLVLNSAAREWDGGLVIPGRLPEGYYTLRAYTKALAGEDRVFTRPVFILNEKQKGGGMPAPAAPGEPQLRFYPEGGSLVNGIDNSVAIMATSGEGYPIQVRGRILEDTDKKMADFQTDANGLALVKFAPYKNRRYKAEIEGPEERTRTFDLPPINYRASLLTVVAQSPNSVRLRVALGDSIYAEKPAAYLLGLSRGQIRFAAMGNGMFEVDAPLDQFPEGPATFLLYNGKQEEISRRVVYVPGRKAQVKVVPDKDNYASRQKANIALQVLDASGQPLSALLSVSVTDDRLVQWGPGAPGWYGPMQDAALLVQGKGRWTILPPGVAEADSMLSIRGRLVDRSGSPAAGQVVTVLAEGTSLVLSDTSGADGRFAFDGLEFPDAAPFMAQVNDPAGAKKGVRVVLDQPAGPRIPVPPAPSWMASSEALRSFRLQQADSMLTGPTPVMLEEIRLRAPKGKKARSDEALKSASSRMITGEQLDKLGLGTTTQAVLMLPGVMLVGDQITIRGGSPGLMASGTLEPLLIIDGVPSGGGSISSQLNALNPKLIESIEVITGGEAARYGARAGNGVIVVKTANMMRDDAAAVSDRGMQYIYPQGYHQRPDFYAPPYDAPGVREATFTDNRSTLFWNGELQTDKSGAAKFSFFTSDLRGTYSLRIVGITAKGDLIDEIIRISRQ